MKEFAPSIVILLVLAMLLYSLVFPPPQPVVPVTPTLPIPTVAPTPMGNALIGGAISRFIDYEVGVACYKHSTRYGVSIYCIPLSDTNFKDGEK